MKKRFPISAILMLAITAATGGCAFLAPSQPPEPTDSGPRAIDPAFFPHLEMAGFEARNVVDSLRANFKLPKLQNAEVRHHENWYRKHPGALSYLADPGRWHLPYIAREVLRRGMPAEIALLPAIESGFDATARSPSGAAGLWQFTATTGRHFGLLQNEILDQRLDSVASTQAALDYLEQLNHRFDGDWLLTLAAYNAGEGTIRKMIDQNRMRGVRAGYRQLRLPTETRHFVPKLLAVRNVMANPEAFGVHLPMVADTTPLPLLAMPGVFAHQRIAALCGLDERVISQLNAAHLGNRVSPDTNPIRVPHNCHIDLKLALGNGTLDPDSPGVSASGDHARTTPRGAQDMREVRHRVMPGDTLYRLSRRYRVSATAIADWNRIALNSTLSLGQQLKIYLD
jgi:membrane-bound lytic murein transglycosylase D